MGNTPFLFPVFLNISYAFLAKLQLPFLRSCQIYIAKIAVFAAKYISKKTKFS